MTMIKRIFLAAVVLGGAFTAGARAQVYNVPLTAQAINHVTDPSAVSSALGGITLSLRNDVSVMFSNPASLVSLEGVQVSAGGLGQARSLEQTQQWFPMSYYANFSLLMSGLSRYLPDPDTIRNNPPNAGDSVQRPFDAIESNWGHSVKRSLPVQAFIGAPFSLWGVKFGAGLGVIQYADLDYYYANSNVLSPDFGAFSAGIYELPLSDRDVDARTVTWYQTIRQRVGSITGYGGALSALLAERFSLGASALILTGRADDSETLTGRGILRMHRNFFGVYRYPYDTARSGRSDFSGAEYTVSGTYTGESFTFGISVKPPTSITRKYSGTVRTDTAGTRTGVKGENYTDNMLLPWRVNLGAGVRVRANITLGVEYEYDPYGSATLTRGGSSSKPWPDGSSFRVGCEYTPLPWLALRGGYHTETEAFEPQGNFNTGDPVSSSGYTGGIGCSLGALKLNLAYQYLRISYEDKWATNVNINTEVRENYALSFSYALPWQ